MDDKPGIGIGMGRAKGSQPARESLRRSFACLVGSCGGAAAGVGIGALVVVVRLKPIPFGSMRGFRLVTSSFAFLP